jgi:hypothetical protein
MSAMPAADEHRGALAADASVLRALTVGLAGDGRPMHWRAMPWDILSNWSEEDRRALVAYLRTLPPVPGRPAADTFSFGDAARR